MDPRDEAVLGLLQAYVDDALPPDEAARVRAAIDADPALGRAERELRALSDEISIFVALGGFPPLGPGGGPPREPVPPPVRPTPGVRPVVRVGAAPGGAAPGVRPVRPRRPGASPVAWLAGGAVVVALVGALSLVAVRARAPRPSAPRPAAPARPSTPSAPPARPAPAPPPARARVPEAAPEAAPPGAPTASRPPMTAAIDGAQRIATHVRKGGYASSDRYRLSDGQIVRLDFDTAPLPPLPVRRAPRELSMDPGTAPPVRRTPSVSFDTMGLFVRVSGDVERAALDQARAHVVVRAPP
jgi:hypothetical protein